MKERERERERERVKYTGCFRSGGSTIGKGVTLREKSSPGKKE